MLIIKGLQILCSNFLFILRTEISLSFQIKLHCHFLLESEFFKSCKLAAVCRFKIIKIVIPTKMEFYMNTATLADLGRGQSDMTDSEWKRLPTNLIIVTGILLCISPVLAFI